MKKKLSASKNRSRQRWQPGVGQWRDERFALQVMQFGRQTKINNQQQKES